MKLFKSLSMILLLGFSAISSANMGVAFVHGTGKQTNAYNDYWTGEFVQSVMSGNGSRYVAINCDFEQYMWASGAAGCLAGQLSSFISSKGITSLNIITHSNGGNVVRWIMSNPTYDSRYQNIINKTNLTKACCIDNGKVAEMISSVVN